MQRHPGGDPPDRPDPSDDPLVVERGLRYLLTVGDDGYEIREVGDPAEPVATFTGDDEGMDAALQEFERLEHPGAERRATLIRVLTVTFGLGVAAWVIFSALGTIEGYRQGGAVSDPALSYDRWRLYLAGAAIGLDLWLASLVILVFWWIAPQVRRPPAR